MKTDRIPLEHRERFDEVAALVGKSGQKHLDPELTKMAKDLGCLPTDATGEYLL